MNNCQVFTPSFIVELMLNEIGYKDENIKTKTILEPSFGNGAFLIAIVERILDYSQRHKLCEEDTRKILNNVYGVEIDKKLYNETIEKLNKLLLKYKIKYDWNNLICGNTLHYKPSIMFDLCVANPPYTKIQHLDLITRNEINQNFEFGGGNTDLYVIFFELCINLLNKNGKLCFITPNSYFRNTSQLAFRKYLSDNNLIKSIIDFSNVEVFDSIATYTAITLLDFDYKQNSFLYSLMKTKTEKEYQTNINVGSLNHGEWVFANPVDAVFLNTINNRKNKLKDLCDIQHGIATNADKVYIVDKDNVENFEEEVLRPVIKASTLDTSKKIIFPYQWCNDHFEVIDEITMKNSFSNTYAFLLKNKNVLNKRDMDKNHTAWYQYARSQGIQNSNNKKIVLKHIISPHTETCEFKEVSENTLVYSGIYIVVKDDKNYDYVKSVISSKEFHKYLFLVGKNMSGGYKSVSAKFVKEFGIA